MTIVVRFYQIQSEVGPLSSKQTTAQPPQGGGKFSSGKVEAGGAQGLDQVTESGSTWEGEN